jgi:hypothetical protein
MKTIQLPETGVADAYKNGTAQERTFLERLLGGKDKLPALDITERVKTFEDALDIVGATDNQKILLGYKCPIPDESPDGIDDEMLAAQAFLKLSIIRKALNEGWEPNWNDDKERKYYLWFWMDKDNTAGSGFAFNDYDYSSAASCVGSRLVFKSEKLAKYAATQFIDLYRQIFIL